MQHLTEEQLILFQYGEAPASPEIGEHLEICPVCRRQSEALGEALESIALSPVPERSPKYGADVWRQLKPHLAPQAPPHPEWFGSSLKRLRQGLLDHADLGFVFHFRRWCLGAGLALLVVGAFLAGRFWPEPPPDALLVRAPLRSRASAAAVAKIRLKELGDHLERSQLALIELINSKTNGAVDISIEQVLARELIDVNRLFCRTAAQLQDDAVMSALEDLEWTLLEISNSPPRLSSEQFVELRRRLGPDAVLCKIKVLGAQVRAREKEAAEEERARHRS